MSAAEFEEFEELEDLDALDEAEGVIEDVADEAMQSSETAGDLVEKGATAETSAASDATEVAAESSATTAAISSRFGWLSNLTVYDAMLLTSLVVISLACLLMLMELFSFGFPFFQWRIDEADVNPLRPPV